MDSKNYQDHFFRKAKTKGYRSRSAFKLIELDEKFKLEVNDDILIISVTQPMKEIEPIKDKNIIVCCRSGIRSSKATNILLENDFQVFNLSGGILSWKGELTK